MKAVHDNNTREMALDTRRSFILEAPAGSGKTAILTARFLALLAEVKHPRQIMAVTFTRKAAAEMAERVIKTLKAASRNQSAGDNPWEQKLLELGRKAINAHSDKIELMLAPDAFFIDTFHGFCASVVRGWPIEAQAPAHQGLLDDIEQKTTAEKAVDEYIRKIASGRASQLETKALEQQLAAANNSIKTMSRQIFDLLQRRDRLGHLMEMLSQPGFERELDRRVELMAGRTMIRLCDYFEERLVNWQSLKSALENADCEQVGKLGLTVPGAKLNDVAQWKQAAEVFLTKSHSLRKVFRPPDFPKDFKKTKDGEFVASITKSVAHDLMMVAKWPEPEPDNAGFEALVDMLILAGGALRHYRELMNDAGADFLELEISALRALQSVERPGDSLIFFHEHLRHILVDEAQDVNDTQVQMLSALIEGWEPGDRRSVFLVGDPKQSIYRFRRAEVSLFEDLKLYGLPRKDEARFPLESLALQSNFRSCPALVDFNNSLFSHIMANPDKDMDEVDFGRFSAAREISPVVFNVKAAIFNYWKATNKKLDCVLRDEARSLEAQYVARSAAVLNEQKPDASIGVLIPTRTHLSFYVRAFEALGLPVKLMEGVAMLTSPDARYLLNLFKAMLRPYDDVAWAGVIRSPWCRVPDSILMRLVNEDESEMMSVKLLESSGLHPEIARFVDAYHKVKSDFGRVPWAETIQRLWEKLNGPGVAGYFGAGRLANSMEFFRLLRQCPIGVGEEALSKLERLIETAYTPPDPAASFSRIEMMTIHKAKGLEFDHVFVVALDHDSLANAGRRSGGTAYMIDRMPGVERLYLASSVADRRTGKRKLAASLLKHLDDGRTVAEQKRLFYVAATRARESLVLTGLFQKKAEGKGEGEKPCPVNWLWQVCKSGCLESSNFQLLEDPVIPDVSPINSFCAKPLELPPPFNPEPLPYFIRSPSRLEDESAVPARYSVEQVDPHARAKGVVIHMMLESLASRGSLPTMAGVRTALMIEGLSSDSASEIASEISGECTRAWNFKEFHKLRDDAVSLIPEWPLEDYSTSGVLRVGRVDLMVDVRSEVVLVDYKTGAPDGDVDEWVRSEVLKYRPQMKAYVEMASKVFSAKRVVGAFFFTAIPHLMMLDD